MGETLRNPRVALLYHAVEGVPAGQDLALLGAGCDIHFHGGRRIPLRQVEIAPPVGCIRISGALIPPASADLQRKAPPDLPGILRVRLGADAGEVRRLS